MTFESLQYDVRDHMAILRMNRPESRNALGGTLRQDLIDGFAQAEADRDVRVIVLTGAGKAFCAGGDLKDFNRNFEQGVEKPIEEKYAPRRDLIVRSIFEAGKPVIAAVNGAAAGAGMNIALAADIRYASTTAVFSQSFVKRGVHPDFGGTYFLPRIVGAARAAEMIFTGDLIDAEEALRLGIVSRLLEPEALMEAALDLARRIAAGPPVAIRLAKKNLRLNADASNLQEALDRETAAQNLCFDTQDAREGMKAFVEKREPVFRGE
ncbi:MAG: enoyl-CoA hydratase/isomerase family protein [Flavobacteriaceae bacterium]